MYDGFACARQGRHVAPNEAAAQAIVKPVSMIRLILQL
jgi:hypothetical protein